MMAGKQVHHGEKLSNYANRLLSLDKARLTQIPLSRLTSAFPGSAEAPVQPFSLGHPKKSVEQRILILL